MRKLKVSVISDVHLATHASKAKVLLKYLKSIHPETLVLNGDIIDSWRFSRNYFPKSHLKVVRQLIKMLEKGVKVVYVTGNHDEFLRKFNGSEMGNLKIVNQFVLEMNGKKTWIFHGDIFDHIIHQAKWLAKIGAASYGLISLINAAVNRILLLLGYQEVRIYKSIKKKFLKENTPLSRFEQAVIKVAAERNYQTVICGHTHVPKDKKTTTEHGEVRYINCGDWVEHFTSAEYENNQWNLVYFTDSIDDPADEPDMPNEKELYNSLFQELALTHLISPSK